MIQRITILLLLLSCVAPCAAGAPPLSEIFHVPFDGNPNATISRGAAVPYQAAISGYQEGLVGQAALSEITYTGIRYDGRGNINLCDRGTFAFFWKPSDEPGDWDWVSIAGVSTDLEGYWANVVSFIGTQDLNKQSLFSLRFWDIGRYSPVLEFEPVYKRWHKGEWHHLAVVWDRNEGITIYEDGVRADSNWGKFRWNWSASPRMLVFGQWQYSGIKFAVDEAHSYAECLTDAQVAQLAKGEKPTGAPIAITPPEQRRETDLARMGWTAEDLREIPVVMAGDSVRYTFARIVKAVDANRMVAQPFEGLRDTVWPIQKYGASTKGKKLAIYFAPYQAYDRVRLFAQRPFEGRLMEVLPGVGAKKVFDVRAGRPLWRAHYDRVRTDPFVLLERDFGQIGQMDFYRVQPEGSGIGGQRAPEPKRILSYGTAPLEKMPPTQAGIAALGETPARFDNPVRATSAVPVAWKSSSPAFGGFQMLSEMLTEPTPLEGVIVKLVVEGLKQPMPVRIVVKEPVFTQRDWFDAEAVLTPKGDGPQVFTFHLTGRPVINYPKRDIPAGKETLHDPGREVAVLVTAANPVTWVMGENGTSLSLCVGDMEKIEPIAVADQTEFAREGYAETNEGHNWPGGGAGEYWGRLYYPLRWLMEFAPTDRPTTEIVGRVGLGPPAMPFVEPNNETGAPDWAFWQMQAMRANKRIVTWIVDNRQVENGEYGGVWGDDTDWSEYLTSYILACDDDQKYLEAMRLFERGVYAYALKDGVSRTIRDNLHSYEEGMGAICHQLMFDYGDPIAFERVMRAASHYYPKWMKKNEDGTYSFRSNYFGYDGVYAEGSFGVDSGVNNLMLFPAAYLTWYNRFPTVTPFIAKWKRGPKAQGLVGDAWLRLTVPDDAKRMEQYVERVQASEPSKYPGEVCALLDETGMRDEWRDRMFKGAQANPWRFFQGGRLNDANYADRMTEYYWLAWVSTGNAKWLVESYKQGCRFINDQEWLYTVAQPSTDRIPQPVNTVIRARLGAMPAERGAAGCFWPRHGLSYTKGSEQVAALVTTNTDTKLVTRFYSFNDKPNSMQVRLWRLLPGTYRLTLSNDKDNDGAPEGPILSREIEVDRGVYVDLELPPMQGALLSLEAIRTEQPNYDLPDPALSLEDFYLEYGDHLHFQVHNIGSKPVENLLVRIRDGYTGAVVAEKTIAHIDPPLDLMPRTEAVEIQNLNAITRDGIIVELDPDKKNPDLNRYNNRVIFRY